ncbi:tRNA cyclic N6-threonylcarbamoyladenosine(37) synthase TcdA [Pelagicoccus sp. SDUM812003]|uniref:tRNA cyclic N6-threonylcarbamoyladenosine(37) synthase TcdA n=1 Tax=Pelagicoccus sp. SDUM812003 TaxID=3041267 RepID=UPI00280F2C39|nr:tRNA cyclic N6-threonylcarbamoyladenosine(37) synthase TcdA [Pelagicoccus sp. SDUM812003]MDQ8203173.1 tRNA cyclic N6-threonylcarbamoyladenosine(37) synthase TcdA [Pelagicoccus sp. SDUM812003]
MAETKANYEFRFGGIGRLYGVKALETFRRARVCVVGIGGVGSWIVEALARSGVGHLTLVDLDDICESNINRQIHALDGAIGASKVETMAERCRAINPDIQVGVVHSFLTERNAEEILSAGFDYVIDAIDSSKHKVAMIVACRQAKVPVLTIGGAGGRVDPTQIQIADLSRSFHDPLLQRVRKLLRQQHGFPRERRRKFHIDCVFSPEEPRFPEACDMEDGGGSSLRLDCSSGYGAATHITGGFGFFAVSAVLKALAAKAPSAVIDPRATPAT